MRTLWIALWSVSYICINVSSNVSAKDLEQVKFSDLFIAGTLGDEVIVQVPDGKMLVFDERASPFALEGKNIIVRAKHARVTGKPILVSFSEGNVASAIEGQPDTPATANSRTRGDRGKTGKEGNPGAPSGTAVFDIGELTGDGGSVLTIKMRGQTGGRGQKGGQGGRGGQGSQGRSASDNPLCDRPCPDTGGEGAQGGQAGSGGVGGTGGQGGTVYVSRALKDHLKSKSSLIVIDHSGGDAGQPGAIGLPGIGGEGGARGQGSNGCRCSSPPGPGPEGKSGDENAEPTPIAKSGPSGSIKDL